MSFGLAGVMLAGCGHCSDGGGARSGVVEAPEEAKEAKQVKVPGAEVEQGAKERGGDEGAVKADPEAEVEQKCDRSLPWEARKACWAKKGIWPHAPAMSEAEWQALDIHKATLEEVRALIPRAVTGDVCAALASQETDKWKRWSAALPVELEMAIFVIAGPDAFEKVSHWWRTEHTPIASSAVMRCGERVVFWAAGGGGYVDEGAKEITALGGIHVTEVVGFPLTLSASQVRFCSLGWLWPRRCLLLLRQSLISICPRWEFEDTTDWKRFCPMARGFLRDRGAASQ